jgi:2-keto-3-deoxy-L-rhamnonate aldolase RhmA
MKPNRFRQVVKAGRIPLGTMVWAFGTRGMPKILEAADVDFVLIDMEHSTFGGERVADLLALFKATPIAPFVRVPQPLYHFPARAMDAGALGVMVANVETPEQAREIVSAVKYAPMGRRGVGLGTSHTDFVVPDPASYFREANENTTVIAMIESPRGVANAEAIAATPGVDVLWVGHFDLTQAMGIPAQFHHADFLAARRSRRDPQTTRSPASPACRTGGRVIAGSTPSLGQRDGLPQRAHPGNPIAAAQGGRGGVWLSAYH